MLSQSEVGLTMFIRVSAVPFACTAGYFVGELWELCEWTVSPHEPRGKISRTNLTEVFATIHQPIVRAWT